VRDFLRTETGGGMALAAAGAAALVWANVSPHGYESFFGSTLGVRAGSLSLHASLRRVVDQGLMTFFFLLVGLQAKRELDVGELRQRRRAAMPALAALAGMAVPAAIFEALNAGGHAAHGWGAAISTDTAFALGALALAGPRPGTRLRVFLLTLAVFDDLASLAVITAVYTGTVHWSAAGAAVGLLGALLALRFAPSQWRRGAVAPLSVALWIAMFLSGIDPVVVGLLAGLATSSYPRPREELERATALTRAFREQPTPQTALLAQRGLGAAVPSGERLAHALHPWTSFVILPLFALANTGVHVTGSLLAAAAGSSVALGIALGYLLGKPAGIMFTSWLLSRRQFGGQRPPVGWPVLATGASAAGIGFTISLLISGLAFRGRTLQEAKLGALASVLAGPLIVRLLAMASAALPERVRARGIAGTAAVLLDLSDDVDPGVDHVRGPQDALVTLIEYGDFECPYCGRAERLVRELLVEFGGELRYVWRHLPLADVHSGAQLAAEASEAAADQGLFWDAYDILIASEGTIDAAALDGLVDQLDLDGERFFSDLQRGKFGERVARDVASADASGVTGTPTFFINGRRHQGTYDLRILSDEVRIANRRARLLGLAASELEPEPERA
jgi:Na+/H+ antiporter NhaA